MFVRERREINLRIGKTRQRKKNRFRFVSIDDRNGYAIMAIIVMKEGERKINFFQ